MCKQDIYIDGDSNWKLCRIIVVVVAYQDLRLFSFAEIE